MAEQRFQILYGVGKGVNNYNNPKYGQKTLYPWGWVSVNVHENRPDPAVCIYSHVLLHI
jgi:hypothetical protein